MFERKNKIRIKRNESDRTFKGILEAIHVEEKEDKKIKRKKYYFVIKKHFFTYTYSFTGVLTHDLRTYYRIGEPVIHIKNYPIPVKLNRENNEMKICVECGELIPFGKRQCPFCGKGIF